MSRQYKTIRIVVECVMQDMGDEVDRKPWSLPCCKDRAKEIVWNAISDYAGESRLNKGVVFPVYSDSNSRIYAEIYGQKFYEPEIVEEEEA